MNPLFFAGIIGDTAREFGVDWPHFIAQVLSFGIVATLLYFFAYKRVLAVLEERRQRIAESLENAEKIKAQLAEAEIRQREILNQANDRANKLIEEARAAAARVQAQETQRAVAAAEQIVAKAREASAQDHARMLIELKREVGRLVVQTTAAVTGKVLTPEDQRRLIEDANKQLGT
jgi:F-type H+-transporting ATPase subunit b